MSTPFPTQRWHIPDVNLDQVTDLSQALGVSSLMAQVLINRGVTTQESAQFFLDPETRSLPSPLTEFADLTVSVELLATAIAEQQAIKICGDYDADGMTSTALFLRALRHLGAIVDYAIPSRMQEGYGINQRIVEDCAQEGVALILTVDNGIAAPEPIAKARELGIAVIVTDHHDIPPQLPPANAILNPKLLPQTSPYWGLAGVGVSYVLAICLAQTLGRSQGLSQMLLELFTLGTIADLAPLVGVNRRWVKRGLRLLPQSQLEGVKALIQVAGVDNGAKPLKPDAIGFRLGPRINAVGRIGDPQVVIDLLTTDDPGVALERAMQCEATNQQRQQLCTQIEQDALAYLQDGHLSWQRDRVLVIVRPDWHHGVIGIVASRLVEHLGVPVFIGTYEEDGKTIRGSARSIPEFHIFEALEFCGDLLERFGGHQAAGGFSLRAENLDVLRDRLGEFAHQWLQPEHLKPLIKIDSQADFVQLTSELHHQLEQLHPCGMENPNPIFWTPDVKVSNQRLMGNQQAHVRLNLQHRHPKTGQVKEFQAVGWRWGAYYPLPDRIDVAYRLNENHWNGDVSLQLELVGLRSANPSSARFSVKEHAEPTKFAKPPSRQARRQAVAPSNFLKQITFEFQSRTYQCQIFMAPQGDTLQIQNPEGKILVAQVGTQQGYLSDRTATGEVSIQAIDITQAFYQSLIATALDNITD
jgi:single-stranded-DNA-specific exonuclease